MSKNKCFDWTVIGAGPAGILSVGKLIDAGVDPKAIAWVDPDFKVGDLGQLWRNVSSNTKVRLFQGFLHGCSAFKYQQAPQDFAINHLDVDQTCSLYYIADPLQWVSDHLTKTVEIFKDKANRLVLAKRAWQITLSSCNMAAKNVILATGAEAKVLPYSGPSTITLRDALDRERLASLCQADDVVAVFGSSHSAILVIGNLVEQGVKRIINFYLEPLRYAVELDNWILFDDTGLKGKTAEWAREHIDGEWPSNLERVICSQEHLTQYLPACDKAVYAVGFERRHLPVIAGLQAIEYNSQSGIIAPGLFGIGIAFPECRENPFGIKEYAVGLWKFMTYIDRVLPVWMKYSA